MLVDAHAHLDDPRFAGEVEAVVARAQEAGVVAIVTCGVSRASSEQAIAIAEQHPIVWAAVGVHPNETARAEPGDLAALRRLARHPKVVAIGEIGLDCYRDQAPLALQEQWLIAQLDLAAELELPVCLHVRAAYPAVLAALRAWRERGGASPGMFHCFSGTVAEAAAGRALGLQLSVAGPLTYPRADELAEVVRQTPLEALLTETDSPYLAPQDMRGQRNEPARVAAIARRIAQLKELPVEEVAACTATTARQLFRLPA
ncbi:MAG: TatD family hydrolase [Chloroflexi bacterium]|nr:TatD family hydrolase [Chloroflexota bacterium]